MNVRDTIITAGLIYASLALAPTRNNEVQVTSSVSSVNDQNLAHLSYMRKYEPRKFEDLKSKSLEGKF